jgi:hypothetical protein
MIERVFHQDTLCAIIIRADYQKEGIEFFTPGQFSQQLGYMKRAAGYCVPAHVHNKVRREITLTNEVLFLKRGKIRIDFYSQEQTRFQSRVLSAGDVILLAAGGHGLEFLEESEIIEVKQGPYSGDQDKSRF